MKKLVTLSLLVVMVMLLAAPSLTHAQSGTLVVYATKSDHSANKLDVVFAKDTLANGAQAHAVYSLVSRDTTYIFDATISVKSSIEISGVLGSDGRPPCIQPDVLSALSIPGVFFSLNGNKTTAKFKNLYLLGTSISNTINYGSGQGIQVSADSLTLSVDNVI